MSALFADTSAHNSFDFHWKLDGLDQERFHTLASLLSALQMQQDPVVKAKAGAQTNRDGDGGDSDDDGDDESDQSDTTVAPRNLVSMPTGKQLKNLKRKFLDRVAEVISGRKGGNDVTATILVESRDGASSVLYVAKNEGLGSEYRKFLGLLEVWMGSVHAVGERKGHGDQDLFWKKMIEHNRERIGTYIAALKGSFTDELKQKLGGICGRKGIEQVATKLVQLQELCLQCETTEVAKLSDILLLCKELRAEKNVLLEALDKATTIQSLATVLWRNIAFLGRLPAAYEVFTECAKVLTFFQRFKVIPLDLGEKQAIKPVNKTSLSHILATNGIKLPPKKAVRLLRKPLQQPLYVHAEIQLVMHLETIASQLSELNQRIFPYIGSSKKNCYLCSKFLEHHGSFRTRGSHGKVYPQWTIPAAKGLSLSRLLKVQAAVTSIEWSIVEKLKAHGKNSERFGNMVAESSVGVGTSEIRGSTSGNSKIVPQQWSSRADNESKLRSRTALDTKMLGKQVQTVLAVRIPGDESKPTFESVPIHEKGKDYTGPDLFMTLVPDLSGFWGASQFERKLQWIDAHDQNPTKMDGDYHIYWNLDEELGHNKYLHRYLIRDAKVPGHRQFWCGDVVILKLKTDKIANPIGYLDMPSITIDTPFFKERLLAVFKHLWDTERLEKDLKLDAEQSFMSQKMKNDKELLLARMSPAERDVLSRMPPMFLDFLALTECDEGGYAELPTAVPHPTDPEQILIRSVKKRSVWRAGDSDSE